MVDFFWAVLSLFLLYVWLKGHWFGWVVAWPAIAWIWLLVTEVPHPDGGPRWSVLFYSGALAGLPMAVRSIREVIAIGRAREVAEQLRRHP